LILYTYNLGRFSIIWGEKWVMINSSKSNTFKQILVIKRKLLTRKRRVGEYYGGDILTGMMGI